MSERKLATIRTISEINSIEGADRIEVAIIDGWQAVVKKGEFKVNDACIYCEIDSLMPELPVYDFLSPRKYRIRTIKLKKQISQGLVLPYNDKITSEYLPLSKDKTDFVSGLQIGDDVTEILGITKYLSPSERESVWIGTQKKKHNWFIKFMSRFQWFRVLFKVRSKSFPTFISKTDEERLQNMKWILKDKENDYYITEKLDGQSSTYWYKKGLFKDEFGICSRNVKMFDTGVNNWSRANKKFGIKEKLKSVNNDIAIQGELCGPNIQGNKYKLNDLRFFVFNVFDISKKEYYDVEKMIEFCNMYKLEHVPILDYSFKLKDTVDEMVDISKGKSTLFNVLREGIVIRCINDHKKSFKTINPEFLLKYDS